MHLVLLLLALIMADTAAAQPVEPIDVARIDRFARESGPFCARAASSACFDRSFRFADRDRDDHLSLPELQSVQRDLFEWMRQNRERLSPEDRRGVFGALAVVELAGLPRLFASYDADHDGSLSRAELLADVQLDERPLAVLVRDRNAIDWSRLRGRLGAAGPLLDGAVPSK
jgi:hypothetical protein